MIQLSRAEIQKLATIDASAIDAIRDAYIAISDGRGQVPPVGYLGFPDANGDCHIKYGYIAGDPIFVVKIAAGFYNNPQIGLPSSHGIIIALSAKTGAVVAILNDEGLLTDLRTGIGGAVATFALCRDDASVFSIVGTGTQARYQIRAIAALAGRPVRFNVWGRSQDKAQTLREEFIDELDISVSTDLETMCRQSDVIITTTPSTESLIASDWIRSGTHITAMGADAPGKRELDLELVARANIRAADLIDQSLDHGEFSGAYERGWIAEGDCVELGNLLRGQAQGRKAATDITIADLTGVATQDIAIARTILARAQAL